MLLALALSAIGCQLGPDQALVGAWTTNRELTKVPSIAFPEFGRRFKLGIESVQLKISSDHTFVLTGLPQAGGKWSFKQGKLHLMPSPEAQSQASKIEAAMNDFQVNFNSMRMDTTVMTPFGPLYLVLDKTA